MPSRIHVVPAKRGLDRTPKDCFLDDAIEFWRPRLRRELSSEDARQITENLTGFFATLKRWQQANEAGAGGGREDEEAQAA